MKFELEPLRKRIGLTQAQLSDKSGVPQTTVSGIEKDGRNPSVVTAAKLADALGVKVDDMLVKEVKQ